MKFLVFNNKNGLGTADKLIVNWDSVKYIKPIDGDTFYIELNNGAYLEFDLSGANTSPKAIEAINRVVKANPNSRILEVKPRSLTEFVFSNIQYRIAASGSIDGSGVQYAVPVFTDTNTLTNLPLGTSGQFLQSQGSGANPTWATVQAVTSGETAANLPSLYVGSFAFSAALADTTNVSKFNGNLAVGPGALFSSVWSNNVTGVGLYAFRNQNKPSSFFATDVDSVAVGSYAGFGQTTAGKNTYVGHEAGYSNTISGNNTAIGNEALKLNNGAQNVAVGSDALKNATSVGGHVALGTAAGSNKLSGGNCIIIGDEAQASTNSVSNEITLGDSNITSLRCNVTSITSLSDERDKKDIEDLNIGLDFVKSLKPRKFVWNNRPTIVKEYYKDEENNPLEREVEVTSVRKGSKDIGFIAQELKTIDNEWSQLVNSNNPEKLEASYGRLIPVLVKAIQELSEKVTTLENA